MGPHPFDRVDATPSSRVAAPPPSGRGGCDRGKPYLNDHQSRPSLDTSLPSPPPRLPRSSGPPPLILPCPGGRETSQPWECILRFARPSCFPINTHLILIRYSSARSFGPIPFPPAVYPFRNPWTNTQHHRGYREASRSLRCPALPDICAGWLAGLGGNLAFLVRFSSPFPHFRIPCDANDSARNF